MDTTKWSAVIITKETHYKLKDLSKSYRVSMSAIMEDLVVNAWNKIYLPRPKVAPPPTEDKKPFRSRA